jgi:hypothetical protein
VCGGDSDSDIGSTLADRPLTPRNGEAGFDEPMPVLARIYTNYTQFSFLPMSSAGLWTGTAITSTSPAPGPRLGGSDPDVIERTLLGVGQAPALAFSALSVAETRDCPVGLTAYAPAIP